MKESRDTEDEPGKRNRAELQEMSKDKKKSRDRLDVKIAETMKEERHRR